MGFLVRILQNGKVAGRVTIQICRRRRRRGKRSKSRPWRSLTEAPRHLGKCCRTGKGLGSLMFGDPSVRNGSSAWGGVCGHQLQTVKTYGLKQPWFQAETLKQYYWSGQQKNILLSTGEQGSLSHTVRFSVGGGYLLYLIANQTKIKTPNPLIFLLLKFKHRVVK